MGRWCLPEFVANVTCGVEIVILIHERVTIHFHARRRNGGQPVSDDTGIGTTRTQNLWSIFGAISHSLLHWHHAR